MDIGKGGDDVKTIREWRNADTLPTRLLISEVDLERNMPIPTGYRKVYRIPATCTVLYCKRPLNYLLVVLEWTWRIGWDKITWACGWIPRYILYKGEWYNED